MLSLLHTICWKSQYKLIFFLKHLGRSWTIVQCAGCHTRHVNGILGLLCKEHFPGFVHYAGVTTPAYTFNHYVAADDARDRDGRQFDNKVERVKAELWVSPRTMFLNTLHLLDISQIMNGHIVSICRISSDARRGWRRGRLWWLPKFVKNSWRTCIMRHASRLS